MVGVVTIIEVNDKNYHYIDVKFYMFGMLILSELFSVGPDFCF